MIRPPPRSTLTDTLFPYTTLFRSYRVFGAQAEGCSPVSAAFKAGVDAIRPVKPDTIAKSLAIGNPADGIYVLDVCNRTGGAGADVTDDQVRDAIVLLRSDERRVETECVRTGRSRRSPDH